MQIQKNAVLKYNLGIMKFSDKLKKLRQEHNLTQNQLADRLGVSLSVIALIESDKRTKFHKQWYKYYPLTLCVVAAAVFVVYYMYYVDQQLIMMIAYPILIFFCLCEFWRYLSK